ncbi:MAG: DUF4258 domain-containing protein [Anaerolineae bacterium]|nr:DUF4258 domain-containing protein [Anaerolineae bacterium]
MTCPPLDNYILTDHALTEIKQRGLSGGDVEQVLKVPGQSEFVRPGRCVYQNKVTTDQAKVYLLRVFVDVDRDPPEVVTAYRTSKVEKCWR